MRSIRTTRRWSLVAGAAAIMLAGATAAGAGPASAHGDPPPPPGRRTVDIQVLHYSDWHGSISTAPQMGALLKADRAANPNTLVLTGGDDFGGTEPVSSLNDDIPAIEVQNHFPVDAAGLGNHNFDGGIENLHDKIELADYPYISANLANVAENGIYIAPYEIFHFPHGVNVAVIGFTNEDAPSLVFPGNFGTIEVTDTVDALMQAKRHARRDGANVFIALGHEGVRSIDENGVPSGELIDIASQLRGFDLVLGDHTDVPFVGEINGAIVSETASGGEAYNRIELTVRARNGRIIDSSVTPVEVDPDGPADPEIAAIVQPYFDSLGERFDVVIGQSAGFWNRASSAYERSGEAELGNLFADGMLASAPGADIAFTNAGGIRSTLSPSNYTVSDPTVDRDGTFPDDIVVGDLFSLHNFGNLVTTQSVTGAQLHAAVEHGLSNVPAGAFPQIAGFQAVFDTSLAPGSRVISLTLDDGTPITNDAAQTLTMATTNFLSSGGDGYDVLVDPGATTLGLLTAAIGDYISAQAGPVAPYFACRMVDENPAGPGATRSVNPLGPFSTRADCP